MAYVINKGEEVIKCQIWMKAIRAFCAVEMGMIVAADLRKAEPLELAGVAT